MKIFILALCLLSGCIIASEPVVATKYPIIELPPEPKLTVISKSELSSLSQDTIKKLVANDEALKTYIRKLQAGITTYNEDAARRNKQ